MTVRTTFALTLSLGLAALATGCAGAPDENQIVELEPTQGSEDASVDDAPQEDGEDQAPTSVEESFDSEYVYADDLTVRLTNLERRVSGEWDMPENTPYVYFDVQFDNATGDPVDLTYLSVFCQIGEEGRTAEDVYTDDTGSGFTSTVMDGRTATAGYGCELPEDESYLQVELTLSDWEDYDEVRETVYFVGDVA